MDSLWPTLFAGVMLIAGIRVLRNANTPRKGLMQLTGALLLGAAAALLIGMVIGANGFGVFAGVAID